MTHTTEQTSPTTSSPTTSARSRARRRVAVVTGASAGVGAQIVTGLLEQGYEVWAAARRTDRMSALAAAGAHVSHLDLADASSIEDFAAAVLDGAGRVDVLVNNAGYGTYGAVENVPIDEGRRQFEVNLFGLAHLTALVLPTMRAQGSGRIVNVSSVAGTVWEPMAAWYHASKAALDRWSDCLRVEVRPFGIEVVTVRPAGFRSEWNGIARRSLRETSAGTAYERQSRGVARLIGAFEGPISSSPSQVVADAVLHATTADRAPRIVPTARGARAIMGLTRALPPVVIDEILYRSVQALSVLPAKRS